MNTKQQMTWADGKKKVKRKQLQMFLVGPLGQTMCVCVHVVSFLFLLYDFFIHTMNGSFVRFGWLVGHWFVLFKQ